MDIRAAPGSRRNPQCGYAGHMRSAGFLSAIWAVLDEAAARRLAVMCPESLWWRCHRRLVADPFRTEDGDREAARELREAIDGTVGE